MVPYLKPQVLSDEEIARIHEAMVTILSGTGLEVADEKLCSALAEYGAQVDSETQRVRFPEGLIDRFLKETERLPEGDRGPSMTSEAGVYEGMYLAPGTGELEPFTEQTLADYVKLARLLDGVTGIHMQNYPVASGRPTEPLELRIFAWKHGAKETGSIQLTKLCPFLLDMYEVRAESEGVSVEEVFKGQAFLISPLRLPAHEAEQIMFFHSHGMRVGISNMLTAGGSGPVTLAGCIALNLAERIAIGIINRVLYGDRQWSVGGSITPLDMRTLIQPYGRPEMLLANLANLQLAEHYKVSGWTHGGLTDAKLPSNEAGVQKLLTTLPCALARGANLVAGVLSIDEIFSPIQMIIDAELATAVGHAIRGFEVTEETLATDLIDEIGPGGFFTGTDHTSKHFRQAQWQPTIWSREMLQGWLAGDRKIDTDRAFEIWQDTMSQPAPEPGITPETEEKLQRIVEKAAQCF